ncbi:MAG: Crp/Fnr family transcriptional regulator [Chloroflexi bacterium]|nr:Crp/Fnr family transcriptional regulator [Chloroflexota bacterium]
MISPERLRAYPFFQALSDDRLRAIAMIAERESVPAGVTLFREGQAADTLYFLEDGCIDLYYTQGGTRQSDLRKGIPVGEINPGEPFSVSALIEPYTLSSTAYVSRPSAIIKISAKALRALFEKDGKMAYQITYQAAKAVIGRLYATRIQLAAAWVT